VSAALPVNLRVSDAATGKPTPVRLRIVDDQGNFYVPLGRSSDFPLGRNEQVGVCVYLGGRKFVFFDGSCEIILPADVPLHLEISKGPEYRPIRETVTLKPGKMALRFTIERWTDTRAEGWKRADTRCHFLSPHDALLEAAAENLDLVYLLATEHDSPSNDGHLYRVTPNLTAFSGQQPIVERDGHAVVVNTFNTHPALGRLGLLHSHRPVFPLSFGSTDQTDDWSLLDWCNQCHRKAGLAVWCDAFRQEKGLNGGEALIAAILGKLDVLEFDGGERSQPLLPFWYRLLNAGVRLPIVGGSGKESNRQVLGSMRTYTLMEPGADTLGDWVEQTRRGRTFVTNGPLLDFKVNGHVAGTTLSMSTVAVQARARCLTPFERFEIVMNGEVVAEATPSGESAVIEQSITLPEGGWLAARCLGTASLFAHTSPVWVEMEGRPRRVDPAAVKTIGKMLDTVKDWIETNGNFTLPKRREQMLQGCLEALAVIERHV